MVIRFLREREVCAAMCWSRSMLWKEIGAGRFPKPAKIGPRLNGWADSEIAEEQQRRLAERDGVRTPAAA